MNLLAGDIGGTKTLLAIYEWKGNPKKIHQKKYFSKDWDSFDSIILDFIKTQPEGIEPANYGCIGVAGRVINNSCKITNLEWEICLEKICKLAHLKKLELINDFSVLIYGLQYLKEHQYEIIQGGYKNNNQSINGLVAILGAGTGLGISRGLISSKELHVFPSEGGHCEFSPRTEKEWNLLKWLKKDLGLKRISLEKIVSGRGLGNIARWLLMQPEAKSHPLRQFAENYPINSFKDQDISSMASELAMNGDQLMLEALKIWLNAYGSAAGDLALQELCYAGLWIGGGTAKKHLLGLKSNDFLEPLRDKGRFRPFLETLPIMVLTDPEAGLFSAGCRAFQLPYEMGNLD